MSGYINQQIPIMSVAFFSDNEVIIQQTLQKYLMFHICWFSQSEQR